MMLLGGQSRRHKKQFTQSHFQGQGATHTQRMPTISAMALLLNSGNPSDDLLSGPQGRE